MLVKWHPGLLDREIDSLLKSAWGDIRPAESAWRPRVDVEEHEDRYELHAELPGLKRENVSITVGDGVLTVSGEKRREAEENNKSVRRTERFYGKFSRTFSLGDRVKTDKISAKYQDGVLTVIAPKAEKAKPKKIEVTVS